MSFGDLLRRCRVDAGLTQAALATPVSEVYPTVIARHLGDASALLGDRVAARHYYEQALEVAGRVRFRPEIALTHLGDGGVAARGGNRQQAAGSSALQLSGCPLPPSPISTSPSPNSAR